MRDLDTAIKDFSPISHGPVGLDEHCARIALLRENMAGEGVDAVWLDASPSLVYYCGLRLGLSERIHGALVLRDGSVIYITPRFERPKLDSLLKLPGEVMVWEEDEDPFALFADRLRGRLAIDPDTPFRFSDRMGRISGLTVISAQALIADQRKIKSAAEIAIMQAAMDVSYRVHKAVHAGLRPGISARELCDFIAAAHVASGVEPVFAAAQFGEATAYPHGVPYGQQLVPGDMVLIDLGARLHGYHSDITRTYVFGTPTDRQRYLWNCERRAHEAAMNAARVGVACGAVDRAARSLLEAEGFGPGYVVPGLPHRTGHGIGLELHEGPWIVARNEDRLRPGMCFSIEPMLCVYGECGIRLEDIVQMTEDGAKSFCPPAMSLEAPFGTEAT